MTENRTQMYQGLVLCFKYNTRIPLIHDASIMVFPLLEWCIRVWPAPLSGKSEGESEREKKAREAQPAQISCRVAPCKAQGAAAVPGWALGIRPRSVSVSWNETFDIYGFLNRGKLLQGTRLTCARRGCTASVLLCACALGRD